MLNRDQWESQLPGDLFCTCHNNYRGNKPYAYFWASEFSTREGVQAMKRKKTYLGDGVYIEGDAFGNAILTTEDGTGVTNRIVLEPLVLRCFLDFVQFEVPPTT